MACNWQVGFKNGLKGPTIRSETPTDQAEPSVRPNTFRSMGALVPHRLAHNFRQPELQVCVHAIEVVPKPFQALIAEICEQVRGRRECAWARDAGRCAWVTGWVRILCGLSPEKICWRFDGKPESQGTSNGGRVAAHSSASRNVAQMASSQESPITQWRCGLVAVSADDYPR